MAIGANDNREWRPLLRINNNKNKNNSLKRNKHNSKRKSEVLDEGVDFETTKVTRDSSSNSNNSVIIVDEIEKWPWHLPVVMAVTARKNKDNPVMKAY